MEGIILLVAVCVILGLVWYIRSRKQDAPQSEATPAPSPVPVGQTQAGDVPGIDETAEKSLFSPLDGNVIPGDMIPDETFASGILGGGVGIEPTDHVVYAPFGGEISSVADTRHAVGITGPGEMEVLIHVGVDTVRMNGDGFEVFVTEGDQVRKGQKLLSFDPEKIEKAGLSSITAVLLTNSDDYDDFRVVKTGPAKAGDKLFTIEP